MRDSSTVQFFRWIGIKRLIPTLIGFLFPGLRAFFSEVEEARKQGRSGGLDLEESRNLCVLDGIFSMGYAIALGLLGMGFYYAVFEILDAPGGGMYSDILIISIVPLMATAVVETIDATRISLLYFLFRGSCEVRLIGPLSCSLLYFLALLAIFFFYF